MKNVSQSQKAARLTPQAPRLPRRLSPTAIPARLEERGEYLEQHWQNAALEAQNARGALFETCWLKKVSLAESALRDARWLDCRLEGVDLSGADLAGVRFRRLELRGSRGIGACWLEASLEDVVFEEANLEGADFSSASLKSVRFENCVLRGARFFEASLGGTVFHRCDLSGADLREAWLSGADLRGSQIGGMQVGANTLKGVIIEPSQAERVVVLLGIEVRAEGGDEDAPAPDPARRW